MDIHLIVLNEFKSEIIDGCIYLSSSVQETFQDLISSKKIHLNFEGNFLWNYFLGMTFDCFSHSRGYIGWKCDFMPFC